LDLSYDPVELGELTKFSIEEDERFATEPLGRPTTRHQRKGRSVTFSATRFPKFLMPAGLTNEQTKQRRKAFNRPKRNAAERRRRAAKRTEKEAGLKLAADLDCRPSAILSALTNDRWLSAGEIAKRVCPSRAFMKTDGSGHLFGESLRRVIARELEKPDLASKVEKRSSLHAHGFTIIQFRRRWSNSV
jgi:hypothetical protein